MARSKMLLGVLVVCCTAVLVGPSIATANPIYDYSVSYEISSTDYVYVTRLNTSQATTLRVSRSGTQIARSDYGAGSSYQYISGSLQPGDVIEVYQPAADGADPPVATPVETYTLPVLTVNATAGTATISGNAGVDGTVRVLHDGICSENGDSMWATRAAGTYSATFSKPLDRGEYVRATLTEPDGDRVFVHGYSNGETICGSADATAYNTWSDPGPWSSLQNPFYVNATRMVDSSIVGVRLVLRRGGTVISDTSEPGFTGFSYGQELGAGKQPLPGDTVEVYRPAGAATPSAAWEIPTVKAIFDAGSDLVAVDAPAARELSAFSCRAVDCAANSASFEVGTKAGRTLFDFKKASRQAQLAGGGAPPADGYDILPDDVVTATYVTTDSTFSYYFDAVPGDLTGPVARLSMARKTRLDSIRDKIKVKIRVNEAAKGSLKLSIKHDGKPVEIAKRKVWLKKGTSTAKLTLNDLGKSLIEQFVDEGAGTQKVKLTAYLKDKHGNKSRTIATLRLYE